MSSGVSSWVMASRRVAGLDEARHAARAGAERAGLGVVVGVG